MAKIDFTQAALGDRTADGGRIGACPVCGLIGKIKIERYTITSGQPEVASQQGWALIVTHTSTRKPCIKTLDEDVVWISVNDMAQWCGVQPITIRKAIERQRLQALRRDGWPLRILPDAAQQYLSAERDTGGWPKGKSRKLKIKAARKAKVAC
jgi:hypothetical protein